MHCTFFHACTSIPTITVLSSCPIQFEFGWVYGWLDIPSCPTPAHTAHITVQPLFAMDDVLPLLLTHPDVQYPWKSVYVMRLVSNKTLRSEGARLKLKKEGNTGSGAIGVSHLMLPHTGISHFQPGELDPCFQHDSYPHLITSTFIHFPHVSMIC